MSRLTALCELAKKTGSDQLVWLRPDTLLALLRAVEALDDAVDLFTKAQDSDNHWKRAWYQDARAALAELEEGT